MVIGTDNPYLYRLAQVESNLDPFAQNPNSSAKGLFQFIDSTADAYGVQDPFDVNQQVDAATRFTEDNRAVLRNALNREPTPGELYLAHQQGAGGASKLLANPNALAVDIVGADAVKLNGGDPTMTAADFSNKWINKFEKDNGGAMVDTIDVELPDGTLIEGVPANITKAELVDRLQRNGMDVSSFTDQPAEAAPAAEQETAPQSEKSSSALMSLPEDSLTRRVGSAARTGFQGLTFGLGDEIQAGIAALPVSALSQFIGDDPMNPAEAYEKALGLARDELGEMREDYPVQSIATEIAGSLPTGGTAFKGAQAVAPNKMSALSRYAATKPVRAGAGTAFGVGSVYGFNEGEGGFEDRTENALKSGAIAVPFGAGGGYVASKLGSKSATLADDAANEVDDIVAKGFTQNASQKAKTSALARLTPEQQARSTALEAAGIPRNKQTAAMISRDPKQWQFEQNTKGIAGVGDDIRNRYVQANELIKGKLNEIGVKTGGKATTPFEAGESVVEAVTKKSREMQDEIGKMYGKIREEVGDEIGMQPGKILNALDEASDNAYADNIVNSMTRKMKRYGIDVKKQPLTNAVFGDPAQLNFPRVPTPQEVKKFSRIEKIPLSVVRKTENLLDFDNFNAGKYGEDLVKGYGDKPLAVKLNTGEHLIIDGHHRATKALRSGSKDLEMRVIDASKYDPVNAGRKAVKETMTDDQLLAELGVEVAKGAPKGTLSVKNAEELRKFANTLRGDKQTDHIVSNIIDALDDDVIDTAGTDAFKLARDSARARFAEFETKLLKNISDEKLVADDVLKRTVYGGKVNDLRKLKESLVSGTDEQAARGLQAWNDLKLQTLQTIIDDSTVASGKVQGSRFTKQLNKIGKERLETVFDPEEIMQLKTIEKALEYTTIEVPESVVNYSGTGAANANNALSGIIQRSGIGDLMVKGAEGFSQIPVVGQIGSPVAAAVKSGGKVMQDAALKRSVKGAVNPESALKRLADPGVVGKSSTGAGIYGERKAN